MRLAYVLTISTGLLLISIIDIQYYRFLRYTFYTMERISSQIYSVDQQRLETQRFITELLVQTISKKPGPKSASSLIEFNYAPLITSSNRSIFLRWAELENFIRLQDKILKISAETQNKLIAYESGTTSLTDLTQSIQKLDEFQLSYQQQLIELNKFFSELDSREVFQVIFTNILILAALFTIIFLLNQRQHRSSLATQKALNETLEDKNEKLKRSQRQLASILEDVKIEKERFLNIAFENEQLVKLVQYKREQLQLIIERAPNALIMVDESGKIVVANAQAEQLFGYQNRTLIGLTIETLVPDSIRSNHPTLRHNYLTKPSARAMGAGRDLTARHRDGHEIPVEIGLNPISMNNSQFVITSIVDLTERRKSQKLLENINKALSRRNEEMEQFVYTVSHDLKSPLVTIGSFTEKLKKELAPQLTTRQHHKLERILINVTHMEKLLADLLQLSKVIRQDVERTELDLKPIIQEIIGLSDTIIANVKANIHIESPLQSIIGNRALVTQCLQNLISNALNYHDSERNPQITISTQTVTAEDSTEFVVVKVRDNGVGIDPKYHKQIFKIFERLDIGEGTGVGLAIVKTVMEKHHGRVTLESEPGTGSTFSLYFPVIKTDFQTTLSMQ